ncbi:MAG: aquaporin [Phycisphaerales bacterium]
MNKLSAGCVAEFLGTFALTFFGAGAIILTSANFDKAGSLVSVALAHAFILFVFVAGCAYISGSQFNPAVSIGLVVAGKQRVGRAGAFIAAQLLGAACAAGMLQALLSPDIANAPDVRLGATIGKFTDAGAWSQVIGLEAIATFALMFVVLTSAVDERAHKLGGLTIGLTLGASILAIGPLTGASLNPARTFGPAICGNHWNLFSAYLIGPIGGACVAAIVYRTFWTERA